MLVKNAVNVNTCILSYEDFWRFVNVGINVVVVLNQNPWDDYQRHSCRNQLTSLASLARL